MAWVLPASLGQAGFVCCPTAGLFYSPLPPPPQFLLCPSPLIECFREAGQNVFIQNLFSWQPILATSKEKLNKKILSFFWDTFSLSKLEAELLSPSWGQLSDCFFHFLLYLLSLLPSFSVPLPHLFFPYLSVEKLPKRSRESRLLWRLLSKLSVFHSKNNWMFCNLPSPNN